MQKLCYIFRCHKPKITWAPGWDDLPKPNPLSTEVFRESFSPRSLARAETDSPLKTKLIRTRELGKYSDYYHICNGNVKLQKPVLKGGFNLPT